MSPKFNVGEVVIINCPILPELHGTEHTVVEICEVTFSDHDNTTLLCYKLGFTFEWQGVKNYPYWREGSLLKKHQPGQMSFRELMSNLKTNIYERA